MKTLITGSAGHLGEALVRTLRADGVPVEGLDLLCSPFTTATGSVTDRALVRRCLDGVDTVMHAATLHKPHVATHGMQDFVDTNVTGTLVLLEEAVRAGVQRFVFTSTTSVFGDALRPARGLPAAWVTEDVTPVPRNVYGVTKAAAEDLCHVVHKRHGLPCVVLRTSRFFPEDDDDAATRNAYDGNNAKANELLFRRVDLEDVVQAHVLAAERAEAIGFDRLIVSATSPFVAGDAPALREDAPGVVARRMPGYADAYAARGWRMFPSVDRVYVNARARERLGWQPRHDFARLIVCLRSGREPGSELARSVGAKGYHAETFADGPFPVE